MISVWDDSKMYTGFVQGAQLDIGRTNLRRHNSPKEYTSITWQHARSHRNPQQLTLVRIPSMKQDRTSMNQIHCSLHGNCSSLCPAKLFFDCLVPFWHEFVEKLHEWGAWIIIGLILVSKNYQEDGATAYLYWTIHNIKPFFPSVSQAFVECHIPRLVLELR